MSRILSAFLIGQVLGLLGWIDPLFIPLVLAGPLVTGALAARAGLARGWIMTVWISVGFNMMWTDWVVNREDVAFHAGVALVTSMLALAGWTLTRRFARTPAARSTSHATTAKP